MIRKTLEGLAKSDADRKQRPAIPVSPDELESTDDKMLIGRIDSSDPELLQEMRMSVRR